jgi:hypothetical protein
MPSLIDLQPQRGCSQGLAEQAAERAQPLDGGRSVGYRPQQAVCPTTPVMSFVTASSNLDFYISHVRLAFPRLYSGACHLRTIY